MKKYIFIVRFFYFFLVLLLGYSCQKEEALEPDSSVADNRLTVSLVSLSELEQSTVFRDISAPVVSRLDSYKYKENSSEKYANTYTILTETIFKAAFRDYEAYTFRIDNPDQPPFSFDNYVVRKHHNGTIEEFILRYQYDIEAFLQGEKRFENITRYDTEYNPFPIAAPGAEKNGDAGQKTGCDVEMRVYHETPEDGTFEWAPGAVCHHTTEGDMCTIIIEFRSSCGGGEGGGSPGTGGSPEAGGAPTDYGVPGGGGGTPGNGGPNAPVTVMEPPLGPEGALDVGSALSSFLPDLTSEQTGWINAVGNQSEVLDLLMLLQENSFSEEAETATLLTLTSLMNATLSGPYDTEHYTVINSYTQPDLTDPYTAAVWAAHFSMQCAVLKLQHPEWSDLRVFWEASKEMVHLALDIGGLVPVVGEVCDLVNGVLYTLEGDGVNASLSFAATIPIAGWFATGAKLAYKGSWKFVVKANGLIDFGVRNSKKFREALGLIPGDGKHAHHIIPWDFKTSDIVQKASKSKDAFHINEALNGIPLPSSNHLTGHHLYNTKIESIFTYLGETYPNMDSSAAYNHINALADQIKDLIIANPNMNLGQISDLINYP